MTKEQYNSLAPYQRGVYDKWNKANRMGLFVAWGITAVMIVVFFIVGITQADPLGGIGVGFGIGVMIGGLIPGFSHLGFLFKKIKLSSAILLMILIGVFILMLYAIIFAVVWCGGMLCLLVDSILFILKKPLIYPWEDKRVLAKAAETAPAQFTPSSADQLNELTQMLNSGLITQEEFDAKKAEIMSRM